MGFDKNHPVRVVVIGGGISGIAQGIRLKQELGDKVAITVSSAVEAVRVAC